MTIATSESSRARIASLRCAVRHAGADEVVDGERLGQDDAVDRAPRRAEAQQPLLERRASEVLAEVLPELLRADLDGLAGGGVVRLPPQVERVHRAAGLRRRLGHLDDLEVAGDGRGGVAHAAPALALRRVRHAADEQILEVRGRDGLVGVLDGDRGPSGARRTASAGRASPVGLVGRGALAHPRGHEPAPERLLDVRLERREALALGDRGRSPAAGASRPARSGALISTQSPVAPTVTTAASS